MADAKLASVDGAISPPGEATISILDDGLLRGDGAFEVIKLYAGEPFRLEDHYARLGRSAEASPSSAARRLTSSFVISPSGNTARDRCSWLSPYKL